MWVTSSPTDGQANDAVCQTVAKAIKAPPSAVSIKRGHASRDKLLAIEGLSYAEVVERLTVYR